MFAAPGGCGVVVVIFYIETRAVEMTTGVGLRVNLAMHLDLRLEA
jgi:hypothetical protein